MPKWTRWLLVGTGIVAVLLGIAAWLVLRALEPAHLTALAATEIKAATGREFAVDGKVDVQVFPPALVADGLRFGNAAWGTRPDMIRVRHAEVRVAFWPLLHGRIQFRNLLLAGADVLLETDAHGNGNWKFRHEGETAGAAEAAPEIALDALRFEDAKIAWRDGSSGRETSLVVKSLSIHGRNDGDRVDLAASLRGQGFTIEGTTGRIESLLAGGAALPVDLAFATDGATAKAKGTLATGARIGQLDLAMQLDVGDTAALSRLVGTHLTLPTPVKLSANVRRNGTESVFDPIRIAIGGQVVTGRASLKTAGQRPALDASVSAASVDLSSLARPAAKAPPAPRRYLFSDAPLPLALPPFDADADLRIERLILPDRVEAGSVHAHAVLSNDDLALKPLSFTIAGGSVSGAATLVARTGKPAQVTLNLHGKGISLEKAAAAVGRSGQISGGSTNLTIDLSGSGNSLHDLMAGATGDVRVVVGPARLSDNLLDIGGDALNRLVDAVNPFHKADQGTELTCAVVRLPLRSGRIAVDRSIAYETSKVNLAAAGTIDLRDEKLALAIRPSLKEGIGIAAGSLAGLVRITGTLMNPTIAPDTLGVAKKALSLYAAIATAGTSLLAEKALKDQPDPHPCQTALAAATGKPAKAAAKGRKKR